MCDLTTKSMVLSSFLVVVVVFYKNNVIIHLLQPASPIGKRRGKIGEEMGSIS